jgi:hypothetical protein
MRLNSSLKITLHHLRDRGTPWKITSLRQVSCIPTTTMLDRLITTNDVAHGYLSISFYIYNIPQNSWRLLAPNTARSWLLFIAQPMFNVCIAILASRACTFAFSLSLSLRVVNRSPLYLMRTSYFRLIETIRLLLNRTVKNSYFLLMLIWTF